MNKKQNFLNYLDKGPIQGYIPFQPILMHFAARFNGHTYGEFAARYNILVESNIKTMEYFDLDWVELISDPYRETSAFGANIEFIPEGVPKCLRPIIKSIDDVRTLKNPDVYKSPRTLDRIRGAELYQKLLQGTIPVIGWIEGPLAEACNLAGVGDMLVMLMLDPDFCDLLMDKCMNTAKEFAKAQIEAGCDVIGMGDAICSQISLETYNRFVKERHRELTSYIHSLGGMVKLHICGNITHLLSSIKDIGMDILDIDWQVNFDDAHQFIGPGVAICGNINPVTIQNSNKIEITQMTDSLIKSQKGKKFILSGGCEITVNTPPENLKTMKERLKRIN